MICFLSCKKINQPKEVVEEVKQPRITKFSLDATKNRGLVYDIKGIIEEDTIFMPVFPKTDLSNLIPEFSAENGIVYVNNDLENSGISPS